MNEPDHTDVPILVATTRAAAPASPPGYSGARAGTLDLADATVTVPRERRPGTIAYPGRTSDPSRHFTVKMLDRGIGKAEFVSRLDARADAAERHIRRASTAFVFVHGFNTDFVEGLFRHAQITHDFAVPGLAVSFSWASAGLPSAYLYDRESALLARDGLAQTLETVMESRVSEIVLVGHSMGAAIVMEMLRDLTLAGKAALLDRIGTVLLASPDIDEDMFHQQFNAIAPRPQSFVVFVSRHDGVLHTSAQLRGGVPRVGLGTDIAGLTAMGILVLDLSDFSGWSLATIHFEFATAPLVMALIKDGAAARRTLGEPDAPPLDQVIAELARHDAAVRRIVRLPGEKRHKKP
jgi:esterase/lipase superfamily enzyme